MSQHTTEHGDEGQQEDDNEPQLAQSAGRGVSHGLGDDDDREEGHGEHCRRAEPHPRTHRGRMDRQPQGDDRGRSLEDQRRRAAAERQHQVAKDE
jgi:hypothetical protein